MFKSATWRSEKKIKVVFKMQFQATQVPHLKAKTLTISLVPADVGKPTVRLGKSSICEGTCSWESPIYETVKLVKETKTGKFRGKIYHFIVSSGSSKAGLLGEVSVDFVDFLGATNPVMISLPLEATNSGATLHVTIQKLERTLDERYIEEDESPTPKYYTRGLEMQPQDSDNLHNRKLEFTEGELEQIGSLRDTRFEDTSAYQVYLTTTDQVLEKVSLDANPPGQVYQRYSDGLFKDISDESVIDTIKSLQENYARDGIQEASNDIGRLNIQIKMLERQGEVSELELQSLRRQITKESRKVQELSEQIVTLKKERDTLKTESEKLKCSPKSIDKAEISNKSEIETKNSRELSEQIKQELLREKHLSQKLRFQLQKTEDSNSELILAVRDLKEVLSRKNAEIAHLSGKIKASQNEETKELEETVGDQKKADEAELLRQEMENLFVEMELSKKEKEELKMCIQQLTLDYGILKKEKADIYSDLEQKRTAMMEIQHEYSHSLNTMKQLKQEIKNQELLYSESLTTISELKTKVKSLEKEFEKKAKDFQDNLTAAGRAMVEQKQRAIQAEEALRKANWSNTKEAEHLREELRRKSEEMISKINENENLAMQAVAEANDLRMQNEVLEKLLQRASDEIQLSKNEYERKLQDLSNGIHLETQSMGMVSTKIDVKDNKVEVLRQNDQNEAKAINAKANNRKIGRLKQEKLVCSQAAYEKGTTINDKEPRKREYADSKTMKKWPEEKEEPERELLLVKMEAKKLTDENITLRTLIDGKKRDEILHSGELGNLEGNTSEIACYTVKSKRNEIHSRRDLNPGNRHENHVSDLAKLSNEVASLKGLNEHMAVELKEMHERYSEISLKFAEVEGERQQLVITLRNLKNGKRT